MAVKEVKAVVKLQILAGKATPAPPVGSALGPHGINIVEFTKQFNDRTKEQAAQNLVIPALITIYKDRSFTFVLKTPPAAVLIKKECKVDKGSGIPNKTKIAKITQEQIKKIAEMKQVDLNAANLETAMSMIAGTARSMGIEVAA